MLFILGLLLMWCEYYHDLRHYEKEDTYLIIGILGRVLCTVSMVHFAWYVLL